MKDALIRGKGFVLLTMIVLLCFTLAILLESSSAATQAGMVTALKGSVTIDKKEVKLLDTLNVGDTLNGVEGCSITVTFFKNGSTAKISGKFTATVQEESLNATVKVISKSSTLGGVKNISMRPGKEAKGGMMLTRDQAFYFESLSPSLKEKINSSRPEFCWVTSDIVGHQYLLLEGPDTERYQCAEIGAYDEKTKFTALDEQKRPISLYVGKMKFPEKFTSLQKDSEYSWQLSESETWDPHSLIFTPFFTCSEAEEKSIAEAEAAVEEKVKEENGDLSPYYPLISFYLENKMFNKALALVDKIQSLNKGNPRFISLKAAIYEKMGTPEFFRHINEEATKAEQARER